MDGLIQNILLFSDALDEGTRADAPGAVPSSGKIPLTAVRLDIPMVDQVLAVARLRRVAPQLARLLACLKSSLSCLLTSATIGSGRVVAPLGGIRSANAVSLGRGMVHLRSCDSGPVGYV